MFDRVRSVLGDAGLDGWLAWDFRHSNPMLSRLLPAKRHLTRRVALWMPSHGEPTLLTSAVDAGNFRDLGIAHETYITYPQLDEKLRTFLRGSRQIAMEFVPGGQLPAVSFVDGGTIDWIRSMGVDIVSSGDLIQRVLASWSEEARAMHEHAVSIVLAAKDSAFARVREAIRDNRPISEVAVQRHILDTFDAAGLEYNDPPIVAVNEHGSDPHFAPSDATDRPIKRGDWLLIDLWARQPGDENIFADVTFCGYAGQAVPGEMRRVFDAVAHARDASLAAAKSAWENGARIEGWQLDDAAMNILRAAGYGDHIKHRTGHSLSPGPLVHGVGMNLDNLETRDTRTMLPGIGFTIEPGLYPGPFGVRLEIDVHVHPARGPEATTEIQREIEILV